MQTTIDSVRNGVSKVKSHEITSKIETITPEKARAYLATQVVNRNIVQARVNTYAADMKQGRWQLTGASISFDRSGHLIDGQHRLHACELAGISFQTIVVRGLGKGAQEHTDLGANRNLAQKLKLAGESNWNARGAIARGIFFLRGVPISPVLSGGKSHSPLRASAVLLDAVYAANKAHIDAVIGAAEGSRVPAGVKAGVAFCRRKSPAVADALLEKVATKIGLRRGEPAHTLVTKYVDAGAGASSLAYKTVLAIHYTEIGKDSTYLRDVIGPGDEKRSEGKRGSRTTPMDQALAYYRTAHPRYL